MMCYEKSESYSEIASRALHKMKVSSFSVINVAYTRNITGRVCISVFVCFFFAITDSVILVRALNISVTCVVLSDLIALLKDCASNPSST